MSFARDSRGDPQRKADSSTSPTRSTGLHAIPDAATLHRHLAEIDVFEVYNARLLFEGYNDEALRFARKYNLTAGAGSDAHVPPGRGHGRGADAEIQRAGGIPAVTAKRRGFCGVRSRLRTSRDSSGWRRPRNGSA